MKNKMSISTFAILTILSSCGSKIGKIQTVDKDEMLLANRLAKLPSGTEFKSDMGEDLGLKKVGDKWQFTVKDNEQTFAFDVDKMKKGEIFDETEFKKMKHKLGSQIVEIDTKLKILKNDLSYLHYGFLEFKVPFGKDAEGNDKYIKSFDPFFIVDKNKQERFEAPQRDTTFFGNTYAILTKRKNNNFSYKDLTGTAKITIGAHQATGDLVFKYNEWDKTITAKNVNLGNNNVGDWQVSDSKMGFFKTKNEKTNEYEHDSYLSATILKNKEVAGSYKVMLYENPITTTNKVSYTLDGVFGMKKQ